MKLKALKIMNDGKEEKTPYSLSSISKSILSHFGVPGS